MTKKNNIPICPSALGILCMKDKKEGYKKWKALVNSAYGIKPRK